MAEGAERSKNCVYAPVLCIVTIFITTTSSQLARIQVSHKKGEIEKITDANSKGEKYCLCQKCMNSVKRLIELDEFDGVEW